MVIPTHKSIFKKGGTKTHVHEVVKIMLFPEEKQAIRKILISVKPTVPLQFQRYKHHTTPPPTHFHNQLVKQIRPIALSH